jgi:hypothetical protein
VSAQLIKRSGILATLSLVSWTFHIRAAIGTPESNTHGITHEGVESNQRHMGPKACHLLFRLFVDLGQTIKSTPGAGTESGSESDKALLNPPGLSIV